MSNRTNIASGARTPVIFLVFAIAYTALIIVSRPPRDDPSVPDLHVSYPEIASQHVVQVDEGPAVSLEPGETVTYSKHIARIFQDNCQDCHRPKGGGPFALMNYRDARAWAAMIRKVVANGKMPPWYAHPEYGEFANERRLGESEKHMLFSWLDNGMPRGDPKELPPPRKFEGGEWLIGEPDYVFEMPEAVIPASGELPYLYFYSPTNLEEDLWLQAVEVRSGNAQVVHHINVNYYLDPKYLEVVTDEKPDELPDGFVVGTAPGEDPEVFPLGIGRRLPAGAVLSWQLHCTPTGTVEHVRPRVGIVLCDEPPLREAVEDRALNQSFTIPAGHPNYRVESSYTFEEDRFLLQLFPHMHYRGKSFEFEARFPDGHREVLLYVPNYDFNWQIRYHLKRPLFMPQGSKLHCTAYFDNSAANPVNPDPTRAVQWGQQSWDEMMVGLFVSVPAAAGERGRRELHASPS